MWDAAPTEAALTRLFDAVEPRRQTLLRRLNLAPGGTLQLVRMRADLLARPAERSDPCAPRLRFLPPARLVVQSRIPRACGVSIGTTPAAILEKIVAYEAVHEIRDWDDLRRRLDPADRRCYGFFHPAPGDEPLIFVEVALVQGYSARHRPAACGRETARAEARADTAVFYSIKQLPAWPQGRVVRELLDQAGRARPPAPTCRTSAPSSPSPRRRVSPPWLATGGGGGRSSPFRCARRRRLAGGRGD